MATIQQIEYKFRRQRHKLFHFFQVGYSAREMAITFNTHRQPAGALTFRSRLSSPSVELTLSYSRVRVGLWRLFFTESWARVFSAFESRRSVSGTASFKSRKSIAKQSVRENAGDDWQRPQPLKPNRWLSVSRGAGDNFSSLSNAPQVTPKIYHLESIKPFCNTTERAKVCICQWTHMLGHDTIDTLWMKSSCQSQVRVTESDLDHKNSLIDHTTLVLIVSKYLTCSPLNSV